MASSPSNPKPCDLGLDVALDIMHRTDVRDRSLDLNLDFGIGVIIVQSISGLISELTKDRDLSV
jgi:hypothetical protein